MTLRQIPMPLRCPTCKYEVLPRDVNLAFPFCSVRCREVDLGRWLGEEYRIADASPAEDEDGQAITGDDGHSHDDEP